MELGKICIYCMSGTITGGVCTYCKRPAGNDADRPAQTLPARFLLCGRQYYLGRVLGNGGFGITYLAWDQKNNRRVAVKEFFPRHLAVRGEDGIRVIVHQQQREEFEHAKMRFQEEAQTLYELRHVPEVIDIFHLFEENGTAYYVMELLHGQDLKGYLGAKGVMSWAQLQQPVCMILRALNAVHKRQMIHRDISPDNIFMLQDGGAKLIDFGNARSYMSANPLTKIVKTRFAPVEQFSDDEGRQGPWTDIYSLSVTLYYALSGILPPPAAERLIGVKTQGTDPAKPLGALEPGIPAYVAQGIQKGMSVMEKQRYHTVYEFSQQLFPGINIFETHDAARVQPAIYSKQMQSKQIPPRQMTSRQMTSRQTQPGQAPVAAVQCVQGTLKGKQFTLKPGRMETLGREKDVSVLYPADSPGISRHQCSFMMDNKGSLYVRDDHSSYGTKLNGRQMQPMEWHRITKGDSICFAKEEYRIL